MSLPNKNKNTQSSCTPVSSNCVIWQGPDIPCIHLCNGDSISDVVAKLAEELCSLTDMFELTEYDLTCLGESCPTPENFKDLIQLFINKICSLSNVEPIPIEQANCPECTTTIASCFYYTDYLGNQMTTMTLQEYAIAMGNRICSLILEINSINGTISALTDRVSVLENLITTIGGIPAISSSCLSAAVNIPITVFVSSLETAFCNLQTATGTPSEIGVTVASQCVADADLQLTGPAPFQPMSSLPGWVIAANRDTLSESVINLWLTVCDLRAAVSELQTNFAACCGLKCSDIMWDFTVDYLNPNIIVYLSGSIPVAFSYCSGTDATVKIQNAFAHSWTTTGNDIVGALGGSLSFDLSTAPGPLGVVPSIYYRIDISACFTNGVITCSASKFVEIWNPSICPVVTLSSTTPTELDVSFPNPVPAGPYSTGWTIRVYNAATNALVTQHTIAGTSLAPTITHTFTGLTTGDSYYVNLTISQIASGRTMPTCGDSSTQIIA